MHLIAAAIARATGARWVADLRDSLVAHAHRRADTPRRRRRRRCTRASPGSSRDGPTRSRASPRRSASRRARSSPRDASSRSRTAPTSTTSPVSSTSPRERFRITHAGSFFGRRDPRPFLQALHDSELDVVARFLGDFREADRRWAAELDLGDRLELLDVRAASESLALQRDSEALLLLIPEAGGRGQGVLSGKVFEYLAVGRPILAAVPPDGAAAELSERRAPASSPHPTIQTRSATRWRSSTPAGATAACRTSSSAPPWRDRLSRRTRVEEMAAVLRDVVGS